MKFLKNLFLVLIVLGVVLLASYYSWSEWNRRQQIEREVAALKSEAEKIRMSNKTLKERIAYFETESFQESVAKEKLNLQKPDEKVVYVKPNFAEGQDSDKQHEDQTPTKSSTEPNYKKWWKIIIGL